MKLSPQSYILFFKVFFTRNKVTPLPPGKYPWPELFMSPQALIFFWSLPFQNFGLKVVPTPQQKAGEGLYVALYICSLLTISLEIKSLGTKASVPNFEMRFKICDISDVFVWNKNLVLHCSLKTRIDFSNHWLVLSLRKNFWWHLGIVLLFWDFPNFLTKNEKL